MGKTIFRMINGRVVPMVVDEEIAGNNGTMFYVSTPKHKTNERKLSHKSSFVIPNATCQKCGKDVFYYENSFGSRVLFDSLGPPWPIHPCYSTFVEKKRKLLSAQDRGWEPVIIKKAVITSTGALKIQGILGKKEIRFSFDEKTFSKMRISIEDAENLIIFGSVERGKIQTHNGKNLFSTRFNEVIISPPKEDNKIIIEEPIKIFGIKNTVDNIYYLVDIIEDGELTAQILILKNKFDKYFSNNASLILKKTTECNPFAFKCKSESHGMYINLNVLSDGITYISKDYIESISKNRNPDDKWFVGILSIEKMQLIANQDDNLKKLLITGLLNRGFNTNYLILDNSLSLSIYEAHKKNRVNSISAKVYENQSSIEIVIDFASVITISTEAIVVNDSYINRVNKKKERRLAIHKNTANKNKIEINLPDIENQISNLSSKLSTAMADAFASAKRRK